VKKLRFNRTIPSKEHSKAQIVIFAASFAAIGAIVILATHAAGFTASFEAENSTKNSPAISVSDASASGGSALKFAGSGSCPTTTPNTPDGPDPWGGCFPGPSTTGVPAGTTLSPSGSLTISTSGTIINARDISGSVVVNAPNVTIRNSRIRTNAMWAIDNNSTGLLIEDSEIINQPITGQPNCHNGIGSSNFTMRRTEIIGCENGVNIDSPGNITFTDNYIHTLDIIGPSYVWGTSGPHTDGIQVGASASNFTIRHNWISPQETGTAASTSGIILNTDTVNPNASLWIENNYINGSKASYAIYAPRVQTHDVYINSNRMLKGGGGYTACVKLGITVTEFNDNRDSGTNAVLSPDNGSGGSCTN
jgi:hypothetical protein